MAKTTKKTPQKTTQSPYTSKSKLTREKLANGYIPDVPPDIDYEVVESKEGYNYMKRLSQVMYMPRVSVEDADLIASRVNNYLIWCEDNKRVATLPGVASAIGVRKETVLSWVKKYPDKPAGQYLGMLMDFIADDLENGGLQGNYNSNMVSLLLRTQHDYHEKNESVVIHKKFDENMSISELQEVIEAEFRDK